MVLRAYLEAEERLEIQGIEKQVRESEENVRFFETALSQKKSEYESGLLSRSVHESSSLKSDISSLQDILAENRKLLNQRQMALGQLEGKKAFRQQIDAARKDIAAIEVEKQTVEELMNSLRLQLSSVPPQIGRAQWQWNQCLWRLSRAKEVLANLEKTA